MDFLLIFLLFFGVGTLILIKKTNLERHWIIFLVRTTFFLKLIQQIAKISKQGWKFFADLAIVFSFSGLGAAYLSKYRKLNKNLDIILVLLGFWLILPLALLGRMDTLVVSLELFISVILLAGILHNLKNRKVDFLVFSLIISLSWLEIFSIGAKIDLIGNFSSPLILNLIALVGGVLGIPGLMILSLVYQGYLIIFQNLNVPGISPFLPATRNGEVGFSAPGTNLFIPLWCFLIAIIVTIIPHEFAHGILAKVHNLKLKSTGVVLLGIIPIGAFVEPDEEELKRRKSLEKMRIFSVGSFSNFLIAIISFGLLLFSPIIIAPYLSDGMVVINTQKGYPAADVLSAETIIYGINLQPTRNLNEFREAMSKVKPGEEIELKTNIGKLNLITVKSPSKPEEAYMGVGLVPHLPGYLLQLLLWIFFINFSLSLVNLLPIIPLDGGRMLKELVESFNLKEKGKDKIIKGIITLVLGLIVINLWPLFKMLGDFLVNLV